MLLYLGSFPLGESLGWGVADVGTLTGSAGGIGYAALFGLLALRLKTPLRGLLFAIAAVGRRSLGFYLFQSIMIAPLLAARPQRLPRPG